MTRTAKTWLLVGGGAAAVGLLAYVLWPKPTAAASGGAQSGGGGSAAQDGGGGAPTDLNFGGQLLPGHKYDLKVFDPTSVQAIELSGKATVPAVQAGMTNVLGPGITVTSVTAGATSIDVLFSYNGSAPLPVDTSKLGIGGGSITDLGT